MRCFQKHCRQTEGLILFDERYWCINHAIARASSLIERVRTEYEKSVEGIFTQLSQAIVTSQQGRGEVQGLAHIIRIKCDQFSEERGDKWVFNDDQVTCPYCADRIRSRGEEEARLEDLANHG